MSYIYSVCSLVPLITYLSGEVTVTDLSYSIVLIMNPSVGETLYMSSFMIFLTIVVLPALSSPLSGNQSRSLSKSFSGHTASVFSSPCLSNALSVISTTCPGYIVRRKRVMARRTTALRTTPRHVPEQQVVLAGRCYIALAEGATISSVNSDLET